MHSQAQLALMAPGPETTALRALFGELLSYEDNLGRIAALMAGSDIRYDTDCPHPLAGRFAPDLALTTAAGPVRLAELTRSGRPLLLDLTGGEHADRAAGWQDRVDAVAADCAEPPAGALLLRPDGYVAWASAVGEPDRTASPGRCRPGSATPTPEHATRTDRPPVAIRRFRHT